MPVRRIDETLDEYIKRLQEEVKEATGQELSYKEATRLYGDKTKDMFKVLQFDTKGRKHRPVYKFKDLFDLED